MNTSRYDIGVAKLREIHGQYGPAVLDRLIEVAQPSHFGTKKGSGVQPGAKVCTIDYVDSGLISSA